MSVEKIPGSFVLYDGECPVCSRFVAWNRLREIRPDIRLIDARQAHDLVTQFREHGIEINDTMVIKLGNLVLVGSDAFAAVVKLGAPRPTVSTMLIKWLANSPIMGPMYPFLVVCRKLLLRVMRREQIN